MKIISPKYGINETVRTSYTMTARVVNMKFDSVTGQFVYSVVDEDMESGVYAEDAVRPFVTE